MFEISPLVLLSLIVFLPLVGAALICFLPKDRDDLVKLFSLTTTAAVFAITAWMACEWFDEPGEMKWMFNVPWIPNFNIYYSMGLDGISFPLVILTSFISLLAMGASWKINKHIKAYCMLFLMLETGMLGVFMALDFFLFYVFWEVMLLPMYFLIGVWGGPRKLYAAIKFFLFTLVGGVLMLIALLMLYFSSDLTALDSLPLAQLKQTGVLDQYLPNGGADTPDEKKIRDAKSLLYEDIATGKRSAHTFNMLAMAKMGQLEKSPFDFKRATGPSADGEPPEPAETEPALLPASIQSPRPAAWENLVLRGTFLGHSLQWWAFLLLLAGFIVKLPSFPVHTWLPDAHVEAPTPISMILAGVLLKMGGYGILRICYPICPDAGYDLAWLVCTLGAVSMVYGAFAALAQTDFKRLVAYSSVSHMGYVLLGIGAWSATAGNLYDADYWAMGMNGAMFQMIAHGISSAGMFFLVGVIYDRVHHRDLNKFGGLFAKMPVYSGLSFGIFFAGLGLPGLCGFIGEVFVVLSVWKYSMALAVISAFVVILTAAYILWTLQRVYLGPEYTGPHEDEITRITPRELSIAVPLLVFAILFGMYPKAVFNYMEPTVTKTANDLADWTETVKAPRLAARAAEAEETPAASLVVVPPAAAPATPPVAGSPPNDPVPPVPSPPAFNIEGHPQP